MRITNSMVVDKTVRNINNNSKRLSKAEEQQSSQSKIQLPSDDPVIASRSIKYRSYIAATEQYQQNVDDAISWQSLTDGAMSDLGDVVKQIRDYVVQGSTDTLADSNRLNIKTSVEKLKEEVIQIMNTSYGGRYIFGGYATDTMPYAAGDTIPNTGADSAITKTTFKGQYMNLGGPVSASVSDEDIKSFCQTAVADNKYYQSGTTAQDIEYNIGYGNKIGVNIEGQKLLGQGNEQNLMDTIDKLLIGLSGETSYKTATIDTSTDPASVTVSQKSFTLDQILNELDGDTDRILTCRADLGSRTKYLELAKDRLSSDYNTYTKLLSTNQDVDIAKMSIEVSTAQYVYDASLSIGAKVISKSLVDYIS